MIGVVGLGFVGLTTALGFCERTAFDVYAFEKNPERLNLIKSRQVPFYEPGLSEALQKYSGDRLHLVENIEELVDKCNVIFYCVGTPAGDCGNADLSILENAIKETFAEFNGADYKVIVIKSTVPPGTTAERITALIKDLGLTNIGITNNPEFLREGYSWNDFICPDRIVIGEADERAGVAVSALYTGFNAPIFRVSLHTGEYIKYLSNALLATLISYSNEMSVIADYIGGIDINQAFNILHMDRRWNSSADGKPAKMTAYAYPGCGYGGYCLPKDTEALLAKAQNSGAEAPILSAVIKTNSEIKPHILKRIMKIAEKEHKIGILGLSFKPESDDVRDTPAKYFIEELLNAGYKRITAHDPIAIEEFKKAYGLPICYEESLERLIEENEILIVITAWDIYKQNAALIKSKPFIDARYCL